jgi:hypothetical protein
MMQVRLADSMNTYYGDLQVHIHSQQRCYEWFTAAAYAPAGPSFVLGDQVTTHRMDVKVLTSRLVIPNHLRHINGASIDEMIVIHRLRYNVAADAKMEMQQQMARDERWLEFYWPVLVCPDTLREEVFEHPSFEPV